MFCLSDRTGSVPTPVGPDWSDAVRCPVPQSQRRLTEKTSYRIIYMYIEGRHKPRAEHFLFLDVTQVNSVIYVQSITFRRRFPGSVPSGPIQSLISIEYFVFVDGVGEGAYYFGSNKDISSVIYQPELPHETGQKVRKVFPTLIY